MVIPYFKITIWIIPAVLITVIVLLQNTVQSKINRVISTHRIGTVTKFNLDNTAIEEARIYGEKAIPALLNILQEKDPGHNILFDNKYVARIFNIRKIPNHERRGRAILVLRELHDQSVSSLPSVVELLSQPETTVAGARALLAFYPTSTNAIPDIQTVTNNGNVKVRETAMVVLHVFKYPKIMEMY